MRSLPRLITIKRHDPKSENDHESPFYLPCYLNVAAHVFSLFLSFFFFFCFLGPHPWYMEVLVLGVKSELQPPAYATATAMQDLSHICDLHHSSWQCWILNLLRDARYQTRNLMVPSQICFCYTTQELPHGFRLLCTVPSDVEHDIQESSFWH